LNQWEELLVYTTDGKLEIDTNLEFAGKVQKLPSHPRNLG
jgi:hypothetical protein